MDDAKPRSEMARGRKMSMRMHRIFNMAIYWCCGSKKFDDLEWFNKDADHAKKKVLSIDDCKYLLNNRSALSNLPFCKQSIYSGAAKQFPHKYTSMK